MYILTGCCLVHKDKISLEFRNANCKGKLEQRQDKQLQLLNQINARVWPEKERELVGPPKAKLGQLDNWKRTLTPDSRLRLRYGNSGCELGTLDVTADNPDCNLSKQDVESTTTTSTSSSLGQLLCCHTMGHKFCITINSNNNNNNNHNEQPLALAY